MILDWKSGREIWVYVDVFFGGGDGLEVKIITLEIIVNALSPLLLLVPPGGIR